jgi:hypothetical protein
MFEGREVLAGALQALFAPPSADFAWKQFRSASAKQGGHQSSILNEQSSTREGTHRKPK